ncbi:hypothetical protein DFJ74DRAFT_386629 [Hyaloraphidium curvatum]|nr:hypothetical protein DFJ74DRAFT_386629 [Hyaloraphidium curvatum]
MLESRRLWHWTLSPKTSRADHFSAFRRASTSSPLALLLPVEHAQRIPQRLGTHPPPLRRPTPHRAPHRRRQPPRGALLCPHRDHLGDAEPPCRVAAQPYRARGVGRQHRLGRPLGRGREGDDQVRVRERRVRGVQRARVHRVVRVRDAGVGKPLAPGALPPEHAGAGGDQRKPCGDGGAVRGAGAGKVHEDRARAFGGQCCGAGDAQRDAGRGGGVQAARGERQEEVHGRAVLALGPQSGQPRGEEREAVVRDCAAVVQAQVLDGVAELEGHADELHRRVGDVRGGARGVQKGEVPRDPVQAGKRGGGLAFCSEESAPGDPRRAGRGGRQHAEDAGPGGNPVCEPPDEHDQLESQPPREVQQRAPQQRVAQPRPVALHAAGALRRPPPPQVGVGERCAAVEDERVADDDRRQRRGRLPARAAGRARRGALRAAAVVADRRVLVGRRLVRRRSALRRGPARERLIVVGRRVGLIQSRPHIRRIGQRRTVRLHGLGTPLAVLGPLARDVGKAADKVDTRPGVTPTTEPKLPFATIIEQKG